MHRLELMARREALGLSQASLGELFDPPVKQATISRWESGRRGIPPGIDGALAELEDLQDQLVDAVLDMAELTAEGNSLHVLLPLRDAGRLPDSFQRMAVALALRDVRGEGKALRISGM